MDRFEMRNGGMMVISDHGGWYRCEEVDAEMARLREAERLLATQLRTHLTYMLKIILAEQQYEGRPSDDE